MKGKLLLALALISIATIPSFAMEISNGKLLSHKESSSANVQASFREIKTNTNNQVLNSKNLDLPKLDDSIGVESKVYDAAGIVGTYTTFQGLSNIYITNDTQSSQIYKIITLMVVQLKSNEWVSSALSEDEISLNPMGHLTLSKVPSMTYNFETPGSYQTYVFSIVQKKNQSTVYYSSATAKLEISGNSSE